VKVWRIKDISNRMDQERQQTLPLSAPLASESNESAASIDEISKNLWHDSVSLTAHNYAFSAVTSVSWGENDLIATGSIDGRVAVSVNVLISLSYFIFLLTFSLTNSS
jgi:hypothetical protein